MPKINNILIVVQRSNGDVFLTNPLITALYQYYNKPNIDILVNDDTLAVAKTLKHISNILTFSYKLKKELAIKQDFNIIKKIYKKYDLSINLTYSDRGVLYAVLAAKKSISAVDMQYNKSWWKKLLLSKHYNIDSNQHIIKNNVAPLKLLNIISDNVIATANYTAKDKNNIIAKLNNLDIKKFIIFHPSAQYNYKVYPQLLRDKLLTMLSTLDMAIIITGGNTVIDMAIKSQLPKLANTYDFIGNTTLGEFIALSDLSSAYIGADTLNMHIAAAQNKIIFAIFGPTNTKVWSPWSNDKQQCAKENKAVQTYGNITIFQANKSCVPCGKVGCDDNGISQCLYAIQPEVVFNNINKTI